MNCPYCGSENTIEKGSRGKVKRYLCKTCEKQERKKWFSSSTEALREEKDKREINQLIKEKDQEIDLLKKQVYYFTKNQKRYTISSKKSSYLKVGIIADLHIGSLYENNSAFTSFMNICESESVDAILCAGDILDGHNIYKGQEYEQYARGFAAQLKAFDNKVPKTKTNVYFITGNHDGSFKKAAGINVGEELTKIRPNWIFCGEDYANVDLATSSGEIYKVQLVHPSGGTAYAISYKTQKIIEAYSGGEKPNCMITGHFHKSEFLPNYRNVQGIQAGTFQRQTPFMQSKALAAHMGGWILEVLFNEDRTINRFKAEFVVFY